MGWRDNELPPRPPPVYRGVDTGGFMRVGPSVVPPRPSQWRVFLVVCAGLGISALPFAFKGVRDAEQRAHHLRETNIDAEEARSAPAETLPPPARPPRAPARTAPRPPPPPPPPPTPTPTPARARRRRAAKDLSRESRMKGPDIFKNVRERKAREGGPEG